MPKVFITNEPFRIDERGIARPIFNMEPAREYGDLVVLVPAGVNLLSTVPMIRTLRDKLRNFSEDDYLMAVGDPSTMVAAAAIAAEINNGRFKLLKWDKASRRYDAVQIDTSGKAFEEQKYGKLST
jgi:hypothetical protein